MASLLRLGTRGSKLALTQAGLVRDALASRSDLVAEFAGNAIKYYTIQAGRKRRPRKSKP